METARPRPVLSPRITEMETLCIISWDTPMLTSWHLWVFSIHNRSCLVQCCSAFPGCFRPIVLARLGHNPWRRERGQCLISDARLVSHGLQSNIVINDEGKASLIDFGLSLTLQATGFTTPMASCTLRYLAPERVDFANAEDKVIPRATKKTDVWAFSMTVVEVCISNT